MAAPRNHQVQTKKSASWKSAFKINTTIYVNRSISINASKVNSCPEKERDEEKDKVKHDLHLKDSSGLLQFGVMSLLVGHNVYCIGYD